MNTDQEQIRSLLQNWASSTRSGRQDDILANHAADVLIFDVLLPLKYESAELYRASWDEWQPETSGDGMFDLTDLAITAGEDVAFASALIHCGGTTPDGKTFEDWVRATFCLQKINNKWLVTHQHISMPR